MTKKRDNQERRFHPIEENDYEVSDFELAPSEIPNAHQTVYAVPEQQTDEIDLVNNLQDKLNICGHSLNISLPQIVVIGSQSSGKSSTLESFVGREFLPRGTGLVTRRPIVVQLIPSSEEYAVFLHKPDEKFTDFSEIREEIIRVTEEECGPKGFSKNPVSLKIYSPRVLKLTVVDLPGIIKVAVGDQPVENIEIVRSMILEYIMEKNSIILAVTTAGQDISSSDALHLAEHADPERERTVGVLTKLDLVDDLTNVIKVLENSEIKLKRGWVGVINRNQKEVQDCKDMNYILTKEREWFRRNEYFSHMAHRMGSPYLQKLLQKILRVHIKETLPSVRMEISQKLSRFKKEMKDFDKVIGNGPNAKKNYMIKLIQMFSNDITVKVMGYSELVPINKISYGAHINYKLYTELPKFIALDLVPDEEQLSVLIANLNGIRNSISIPSLAVDSVCRNLIECFKEPIDASVYCVSEVLLSAIAESGTLINNYPSVKNEMLCQVREWIEEETANTQERLKSHVDAEMFYINIGHPDFDASVCDPVAPPAGPVQVWSNKIEDKVLTSEEEPEFLAKKLRENDQMQKQVKYVINMVLNYLKIVHKNILDISIKYIAHFLVKKVLDRINNDLVTTMSNSTNMESLTEDYESDYRQREDLQRACISLSEALNAIKNF